MKRYVSAMLLWCFVLGITEAQAQLKIDFGTTTTPVENGFQAYTASHEVADTFTAQSFSAFGTTITITPSWASGAAAAAMQMYDRVADGRYNYAGDMADLIADWIGTDTRQPGNPLTLTISGLPKGTYSWLSYHHDGVDQTGEFTVTVNDARGSATSDVVGITDGGTDGVTTFEGITTFTTEIASNGSDVQLVFTLTSDSGTLNLAFFLMNGFELELLGSLTNAGNPSPAEGKEDVPWDTALTWTPGPYADTHDVYLGTSYDDVNDASRTAPGDVLVSQGQTETTCTPVELAFGETYYWRIDEVNAPPDSTIFKGDVWSFTVEPYSYPLPGTNMTATTSGNSFGTSGTNTINRSGLKDDDTHSVALVDAWVSDDVNQPAWIEYAFDRVYRLDKMIVWNSNNEFESFMGY
jgi:hypothetical protein